MGSVVLFYRFVIFVVLFVFFFISFHFFCFLFPLRLLSQLWKEGIEKCACALFRVVGFDPFKPNSYEINYNNEKIGEEETLDDRNGKNFLNGLVWLAWVHNGSVFTFSFFFIAIYQK